MMRQRHNREAAYSDKKQAQKERNGEEAPLVIDNIGRHIGTGDCRGSRERGQHESNGGSQMRKGGFGAALVAEAIDGGPEAGGLNVLWHDGSETVAMGNVVYITREPGNGSARIGRSRLPSAAISWRAIKKLEIPAVTSPAPAPVARSWECIPARLQCGPAKRESPETG